MASISLRAYNREIEGLIDRGQTEEAVAHCMYILQSIPKHIATYRLLGKTLLEMQRYQDAVDVFQRVLSSVPDDFVTHVGMSIIRENEKNLDGAIWHMERAFEAQPANAAIQDELRRLYGRRDGMVPPKIRLTRGALARMYAKGHLYAQAIGELQAALAEDNRRPDLQALLAIMYHRSGQREQAVKTCSDLMKKLPYCLDANRILADLLSNGEQQKYLQRLISLDPYYAHTDPRTPTSDRVPDTEVVVERLGYQPGQPRLGAPSEPEWAGAFAGAFQDQQQSSLPEWATTTEESASPFEDRETSESDWGTNEEVPGPETEDLIPDFLKDAGWEKTDRTADEIAIDEMQREIETTEEEIAPAEIPDWLRDMAPEGALDQAADEEIKSSDDELLPWLQEEEPGPTDSVSNWLEETKKPASPDELESLEAALQQASQPEQEELPDWVTGEPSDQSVEEPVESLETETAWSLEEELPDWLEPQEQERSVETDGLPEGLMDEEEAPPTPLEEEVKSTTADETVIAPPDWIFEEREPTADAVEPFAGDELPEWLNEPESEPPVEVEPELDADLEPSPISEVAETTDTETSGFDFEETDREAAEDVTAWLQELDSESEPEAIQEESSSEEEVPEWLQGLQVEEAIETPVEGVQAVEDRDVEVPVIEPEEPVMVGEEPVADLSEEDTAPWAIPTEAIEAEEAAPQAEPAGDATVIQPAAETEFDLDDPEAALAWLESLAMQQGASAEQLTTRPEDRPETPEWLRESAEEAQLRGEVPTYEPTETVEGLAIPPDQEPVAEVSPEEIEETAEPAVVEPVLEEMAAEELEVEEPEEEDLSLQEEELEEVDTLFFEELAEEVLAETEEAVPAEEIPDWLKDLEPEETVSSEESKLELGVGEWELEPQGETSAAPEITGESEIPDWLQLGEEPEEPVMELEEPVADLSEEDTAPWAIPTETVEAEEAAPQAEPAGDATVVQPAAETEFDLDDPEAALAWLESLAMQQGASAEQLTTRPEDRPETPEWLRESAEEAQLRGEVPTYEPTETVEGLAIPPDEEPVAEVSPEEIEETTEPAVQEPAVVEPVLEEMAAEKLEVEEPAVGEWELEGPEEAIETTAEDEIPDWLKEPEEAEETIPMAAEAAVDAAPDWVLETAFEEGEPAEQEPAVQEIEAEEIEAEPILDEVELQEATQLETTSLEGEALPDWLKSETLPEETVLMEGMKLEEEALEAVTAEDMEQPEVSEEEWDLEAAEAPTQVSQRKRADLEPAGKIDLNRASLRELESLPGVGFILAQAIISHREANGPFASVDDLQNVAGIGPVMTEDLRDRIEVVHAPALEPVEKQVRLPQSEDESRLMEAQDALSGGDYGSAIEKFSGLIRENLFLDEIIRNLQEAVYSQADDSVTWEVLGDAYLRNDQLQEALEAYNRAEALLQSP